MKINTIGVIGHGLMGRGVIHTFAQHGFKVIAVKRREEDERLDQYLKRELERKRITGEEDQYIRQNIESTTDLTKVNKAQLIIENINEDPDAKQTLFRELDKICPPEVIFASNTSGIPIGKLGKVTGRPEKMIGLHYMSPVPRMKLVEIIKSLDTSEETLETAVEITKKIEKVPVVVKDFPGFVASRLAVSLISEALNILKDGVTDPESIDAIAKLGLNLPVGPLELADHVGLDTALNIMDNLHNNLQDPRYRVNPLLRIMVDSGYYGKKNKKGFYEYN